MFLLLHDHVLLVFGTYWEADYFATTTTTKTHAFLDPLPTKKTKRTHPKSRWRRMRLTLGSVSPFFSLLFLEKTFTAGHGTGYEHLMVTAP